MYIHLFKPRQSLPHLLSYRCVSPYVSTSLNHPYLLVIRTVFIDSSTRTTIKSSEEITKMRRRLKFLEDELKRWNKFWENAVKREKKFWADEEVNQKK